MFTRLLKSSSRSIVTKSQIKSYLNDPNVTIIDIRNRSEQSIGIIPAVNHLTIPLPEFDEAMKMDGNVFKATYGAVKPDPSDEIVTYCKAGVRARTAVAIMGSYGYKDVDFYAGSFDEWSKDS